MNALIENVRPAWWIAMLCLAISFAGIVDHDLWTSDEPREGAIALKMLRTGDFIIPRLGNQPFVEKPPLYYILGSSMMKVLGSAIGKTAALRLTSALLGVGTLLATAFLARRLLGVGTATLAAMILATMPGFILITHFILSDNALLFSIAAALALLVEAYETRRFVLLPFAGLFTASAFLSKGLVGPAVIGLGWMGLIIPRLRRGGWIDLMRARSVFFHLLGIALCATVAGAWMFTFHKEAGPALWHEWFWDNNFGRFTGSSTDTLGHKAGPFYYLAIIPVYILPWLAVWLDGMARLAIRIKRGESIPREWWFLLAWGVAGVSFLSLSSTKRDIYLGAILPAFALMTAAFLKHGLEKWPRYWLLGWIGILWGALVSATCVPIFYRPLPRLTEAWLPIAALAAVTLFFTVLMMRRLSLSFLSRWGITTALCLAVILTIVCPLLDRFKSYESAFTSMTRGISRHPEARIAQWNFDETTVAGFYYYEDRVFPHVQEEAVIKTILAGASPDFDGLLVLSKDRPLWDTRLPPSREVMRVTMGKTRVLQWLTCRQKGTPGQR